MSPGKRTTLVKTMAVIASLFVFTVSLSVFVSAAGSGEDMVDWQKGEKWALKDEKDLAALYDTIGKMFTFGGDDLFVRNLTVDSMDINGHVGEYVLFEVIEANSTDYLLKITSVQNITVSSSYSGSGELVEPGSYISEWRNGYYDTYYNEWRSMSSNPDNKLNMSEVKGTVQEIGYDLKIAAAVKETSVLTMDRTSLAIKSIDISQTSYARGYVNGNNVPNCTTWFDGDNNRTIMNVTYESFNVDIEFDSELTAVMTFSSGLEFLKASPAEGSIWEARSGLNMTGTVSGMIDAPGLPSGMEDAIFGQYLKGGSMMGITGLPIDLAKLYDPYPDDIYPEDIMNNGTIALSNLTVSPDFINLKNKTIDDPVFGKIAVNEIGLYTDGTSDYATFYYYPQKGYIVGTEMLATSPSMSMVLSTRSAPVSEVSDAIERVTAQIEEKKGYENIGGTDDKGDGSQLDPLLIIAIVASAAVVAIAGGLYVLKRRKGPKGQA
jgi:hypothetical protein